MGLDRLRRGVRWGLMGTEQDAVLDREDLHSAKKKKQESSMERLERQATGFRHQGASEVEEHARRDKVQVT